jgi:hypothetical protein
MGVGRSYRDQFRIGSSSRYNQPAKMSYSKYESYSPPPKLPNPDPNNYKLIEVKEINNFLVVKIKYIDCTNYEGTKILVYKDVKLIQLINQKLIDPHFCDDKKWISPVARFVPTKEGWDMAIALANNLSNRNL